jgi:LuxR family transcriptional regulator, maltose regulon positive regulatory protein
LHAVEHLIRGGDAAGVAELVEAAGPALLLDGRATALAHTLSALDDPFRSDPRIALTGAAAALEAGDLEGSDVWLASTDLPAVIGGPDAATAAFAATVALARARFGGDIEAALAVLESTPACGTGHRDRDLYALYHRGVARGYVGRYREAIDDLGRAVAGARASRRAGLLVNCLSFLAGAHATASQLPEMRRDAERAIELAEQHGWSRSGPISHARMLISWSDHLRGDATAAAANADIALATLNEHTEPDVELACRSVHLFVTVDRGSGYAELRDYRATLLRLHDAPMAPALLAFVGPLILGVCLDLGERAMAQEIADTVGSRSPDPGEPALLRAMLLHDAGRDVAARRELAGALDGDARCHVVTTEVRAHLLAAELDARRGSAVTAHHHLCEALRIAEPVEVLEPFLGPGTIRDLLSASRGRFGRSERFVGRILLAAAARPDTTADEARLTPAELTILRELPSLLSLREIAESRALSLNTVKFHLRSIYRKFDVTGRRAAVEHGRLLGLL